MTDEEIFERAKFVKSNPHDFLLGFRYAESLFSPKVSNWRTDFNIYLFDLKQIYEKLITDQNYIEQQEKFNPNIDIQLSLEKAVVNFWGTEAGWKFKKKKKSKDIDWKSTLTNAIALNKVWKPKDQTNKFNTNLSYLR